MASLVLRGNIWYITERVDGKPRRWTTGCYRPERIDAEIKLREFQQAMKLTGRPVIARQRLQTLQQQIDEYHGYQLARRCTSKQASECRMRIMRICRDLNASNINDLTEGKIRVALGRLRRAPSSPRQNAGDMPFVSARTRNTYLKSLLAFCRWAVGDRRTAFNPLEGMRCEREDADIRHRRIAYLDQEFAKLYETALGSTKIVQGLNGSRRALIYLVAACTGLRKSEIGSLTPASFRLSPDDPHLVVDAGHSKRRRRDFVRLHPQLVPRIQEALAGYPIREPLFANLKGKKTHKMIQHDLKVAEIPYQNSDGDFRDFHALRHTFISRAWLSGATANVVKELARHADLRETLHYSHAGGAELRRAVDAIPALPVTTNVAARPAG
jgi:integrase